MIIYRPIQMADLDSLVKFSKHIGYGNAGAFRNSPDKLEALIAQSLKTFARDAQAPAFGDVYIFVVFDEDSQEVVGLYKVNGYTNGGKPFYTYKKETLQMGYHRAIEVLTLSDEYTFYSMPSSQLLHPRWRHKQVVRLVMSAHNLYFAQFSQRLCSYAVGEYRGIYDDEGYSVFWRYFLKYFIADWDYLTYLKMIQKGLEDDIIACLPKGPIPLNFIPEKARLVLGQIHPETRAAMKKNNKEGGVFKNHYAYSTAAPVWEAKIEDLNSIKRCQYSVVENISEASYLFDSKRNFLISNTKPDSCFRACLGVLLFNLNKGVTLHYQTAQALNVNKGNIIYFLP